MSNKVLVTGLALGKEVGVCSVCNYDFSWIFRYPSILLWADKILITKAIWDIILTGNFPQDMPEIAKSMQLIFQIAHSEGFLEIVDPADVISQQIRDMIFSQINEDRQLLVKSLPETVKLGDEINVPGSILINGDEYCSVSLWASYGALLLAQSWDAHCLFDERTFNYYKYLFGLKNYPKEAEPGKVEGFHSIFNPLLPNMSIIPEYVWYRISNAENCVECKKSKYCEDRYLLEVEEKVKEIIKWRKYDEINQIKSVLDEIVRQRNNSDGIINSSDIVGDFRNEEIRIERMMKKYFPKIRRWANITTMISIPVSLIGKVIGNEFSTLAGLGLAGASKITEEAIKLMTSKYNWVGFLPKDVKM